MWKELLKPSLAKIILFIVLAILAFDSYGATHTQIICITAPCNQPYPYGSTFFTILWYILALPFVFAEWIHPGISPSGLFSRTFRNTFIGSIVSEARSAIVIMGFITTVIYLYILSCLIVHLAHKIYNHHQIYMK